MNKLTVKTDEEIKIMQEGGEILGEVLEILLQAAKPGVTLVEIDRLAEQEIVKRGAEPSFKTVPGYSWSICSCVNDVVVHGIPDNYTLEPGDVAGIDCGVLYKGFHTDSAWTVYVPDPDNTERKNTVEKFLSTGKLALKRGIGQAKAGNYIYDISKTIQDTVEGAGFGVVRSLVGHGVGRELHEEPEVPNYVNKKRLKTHPLSSGLTIAIEVIYTEGSPQVVYKGQDGWTIATKDGKLAGLFEATVAVRPHGCIVLTPPLVKTIV